MSDAARPAPEALPISDIVLHAMRVSRRGCDELLPESEWLQKLARSEATGVPLRIKLGLDPTAPDIHIGHTVVLNKMRQLQDLGHQVIFLIGDFTSMIGDPSGRNATRPPLTREQIEANAQTYYRQASLVLDQARTEIRYNSEWSDPLGARGMIQLAARYTLARMLERDDFAKRLKAGAPISVHELLYPLMQGYDSVALKSDLELGGTDQKFNLLVGRALQSEYGQEPQCILTMPLLEGLDGVEKMSKSKGNYVGITEPANDMFAKLLSISDTLMWRYYTLLSFRDEAEIARLRAEVEAGRNPKDAKVLLAKEITARFHNAAAADAAEADFQLRARGGVPDEIPAVALGGAPLAIGALLKQANLAPSTSEAMRLVEGGGVRIDGTVIADRALKLAAGTYVVQVGKRRFARVTLSVNLRRRGFVAGAVALAAGGAVPAPPPAEQARIERLIRHVAEQRDAQFVRNGTPYPPKDAAQFLRAKFAKMGEHVGTAAQFIEQIASRSSTTGQPYLIRLADGRTLPVAQFLGDELRRMDGRP